MVALRGGYAGGWCWIVKYWPDRRAPPTTFSSADDEDVRFFSSLSHFFFPTSSSFTPFPVSQPPSHAFFCYVTSKLFVLLSLSFFFSFSLTRVFLERWQRVVLVSWKIQIRTGGLVVTGLWGDFSFRFRKVLNDTVGWSLNLFFDEIEAVWFFPSFEPFRRKLTTLVYSFLFSIK